MVVPDLRAFLAGSWQLDRSVRDRRLSLSGELNGRAHFIPAGTALLYEERGTLTFGAHHGPAEQFLRYEFPDEVERAHVRFCDGRAFHELDLSNGLAVVSHACGPDLYEGHVIALEGDRWQSAWNVTGPRKDLIIFSRYARSSERSSSSI